MSTAKKKPAKKKPAKKKPAKKKPAKKKPAKKKPAKKKPAKKKPAKKKPAKKLKIEGLVQSRGFVSELLFTDKKGHIQRLTWSVDDKKKRMLYCHSADGKTIYLLPARLDQMGAARFKRGQESAARAEMKKITGDRPKTFFKIDSVPREVTERGHALSVSYQLKGRKRIHQHQWKTTAVKVFTDREDRPRVFALAAHDQRQLVKKSGIAD